jgi:hypothetical protein
MPDPSDVAALIHEAAHDGSGYTTEGAFVDGFRYHAEDKADALLDIFEKRGFNSSDLSLIRDAVRDPAGSVQGCVCLLSRLAPRTRPLIERLRHDPLPKVRVIALRAGQFLRPEFLPIEFLDDPDDEVRRAALDVVVSHWRRGIEAHPDLPQRIDQMLDDPVAATRLRVADLHRFILKQHDPARLIRRLETEPDLAVRRMIVGALEWKVNPTVGTSRNVPWREDILRALSPHVNSEDAEIRRNASSALGIS